MSRRIRTLAFLTLSFLVTGATFYFHASRAVSAEDVGAFVRGNLIRELDALETEKEEIILNSRDGNFPETSGQFLFYLIRHNRVVEWSDNSFVPTVASVQDPFSIKLLKEGNSDYLARKWAIGADEYLIGIVPLIRRFAITNNYLHSTWNNRILPPGVVSVHEPLAQEGLAVCIETGCPFRITMAPESVNLFGSEKTVAALFLLAFVTTLICLLISLVRRRIGVDTIFLLLLLLFAAVRIVFSMTAFPGDLISGDLFNPVVFASSWLNPSLGDLLLNEVFVLVLCVWLFRYFFQFRVVHLLKRSRAGAWLLSTIAALFMFLAMLFPYVVIQTLYNNSSISISLSSTLTFTGLRVAALIAILIGGTCSFLFAHTFVRLLIGDGHRPRIAVSMIVGAGLFTLMNLVNNQYFISSLLFGTSFFLIVYLLRLYRTLRRVNFATFTYLFVCVFFLSANGAWALHHFNRGEKIENQFRFARSFLIERDYFAEYMLGEFSGKIAQDAFIQTRVATPFLSKEAVRQKIRQVFLPSYFNKYDVEIFVFNASGQDADGRSSVTLQELLYYYNRDAYRTDYPGVYFINSPAADITQKYLVVVPVSRVKAVVGHVVIEFSLKRIIPETVYPE